MTSPSNSDDPSSRQSPSRGTEPQGATELPRNKGPRKGWLGALAAIIGLLIAVVIAFVLVNHFTHRDQQDSDLGDSVKSEISSGSSTVSSVIAGAPHPGDSGAPETQIPGADGVLYRLTGPILTKYESLDDRSRQDLGAPTQNVQRNPDGGTFQQFAGGVIVVKDHAYVVWGKIRDKWNELGGSQGQLGYPTSDERDGADGQKQSSFEHGIVTWFAPGGGDVTVSAN